MSTCLFPTLSASANPHARQQSYILLYVLESGIEGEFQATLKDLNNALGLDFRLDGDVTAEDVEQRSAALLEYYNRKVGLYVNGNRLRLEYVGFDVVNTDFAQFASIKFLLPELESVPKKMAVEYSALLETDPEHKGLVAVMFDWKAGLFDGEFVALVFDGENPRQEMEFSDSSVWRGLVAVVKLGMQHIWEGIDHILFLIALILPAVVRREANTWEPVSHFRPALIYVLKIVTLFTLAHSVTLSLAALGIVQIPSRIVESIIALSIFAAALDIIYPVFGKRIWIVVFGFGLFHGFGFAGALVDMGLTRSFAGLTLFGFNLGVEIGQVAIIAVAFPVLFLIRNWSLYTRFVLRGGAVGLSAVALLWVFERAFDVNIPLASLARKLVAGIV